MNTKKNKNNGGFYGYNTDHFLSMLAKMNISLSDKQLQQFMTYYEMLIEKNKVMNLTAITDFDEVVEKHFVDSVSRYRLWIFISR